MDNKRIEEAKIVDSVYRYIGFFRSEQLAESEPTPHNEAYPASLDDWFSSYTRKMKRHHNMHAFLVVKMPKVAIAVVVMLILVGITTFSVDALRVRFLNLITKNNEIYTKVQVGEDFPNSGESIEKKWHNVYFPQYIPESYNLDSAQEVGSQKFLLYRDPSGNELIFIQGNLDSELQVDTENATTEDITINNAKAMLIEKNDRLTILWFTNDAILCTIGVLPRDEIIMFSENIVFVP